MVAEVYDAFLSAGAPASKAQAAAKAMADDSRLSTIEADLLLLKWMASFSLAGIVLAVMKLFIP